MLCWYVSGCDIICGSQIKLLYHHLILEVYDSNDKALCSNQLSQMQDKDTEEKNILDG